MIVVHMVFEVNTTDRQGFDQWMEQTARAARRLPGCVRYEYYTHPGNGLRGAIVEAWADEHALSEHRLDPPHVDFLALASSKWGIRRIQTDVWAQSEDYATRTVDRIDLPAGGTPERDELRKRVLARQSELGIGQASQSPSKE